LRPAESLTDRVAALRARWRIQAGAWLCRSFSQASACRVVASRQTPARTHQRTRPTEVSRMNLPVLWQTVILLALSNVFMTFAWYAHLKHLNEKPWWVAALISWGIALFEYLIQVPANRIGNTELSLAQLKILQEVITLTVFVPFVVFYMNQPLKLDYLWAALCMLGAIYFAFRP
jgi:uncharacterized protein (DUF486 family)